MDESDEDDIKREMLETEALLIRLNVRLRKWQRRAEEATDKTVKGTARFQIAQTQEKIGEAQRRLAELGEVDEMHRKHDAPPSMVPPTSAEREGWRLVAKRTLNLGGRLVGPGTEISPDELAMMLNSETLLRGGHIAWVPPQAPRPAAKPAPSVSVTPTVPDDPIRQWRAEVRRIAAARKCSEWDAVDLVDGSLTQRAIKADSEQPKTIADGGWGSSGGTPTRSGVGSFRRITTDSIERMLREPENAA